MDSKDYNEYLRAIKATNDVKDREKREAILTGIRTRLLSDYGLTDSDAERLMKKC